VRLRPPLQCPSPDAPPIDRIYVGRKGHKNQFGVYAKVYQQLTDLSRTVNPKSLRCKLFCSMGREAQSVYVRSQVLLPLLPCITDRGLSLYLSIFYIHLSSSSIYLLSSISYLYIKKWAYRCLFVFLSVGMWRANGNPSSCTDLDEILHAHSFMSKEGFDAGLTPNFLPLGLKL